MKARRSLLPSARRLAVERGVVLFVALIATLALMLGGMALVRAVATDTAIGGNIATRQQATVAASVAIEHDVAALFENGAIADATHDDPVNNYFAARQAGEDARGVPRALQSVSDYPEGAATIAVGTGFTLRHLVERLCVTEGPASIENCTLSAPSTAAASGTPPAAEPTRAPYYRVTVRIDGPAGAATFVQAMLGEAANRHRLSWRVLDE
jgi:type IV pilus assembly protein PilX